MKLELRGITKRFPGVIANEGVDLEVLPGEIHALLGENGAGKTTLMNVLYGLYHADEGQVVVDDREVRFASPRDAIAAGIGMVHQHFMLVPVLTVTENVMLGAESTRAFGLLDEGAAKTHVREISERYGLPVNPDAVVEDLPVGTQQRVEIIKALYREAELLILDEPTAVLTPQETEELFEVLRSLRESGRSIIFITHKLKEVLAVADRITVLRGGRVVGSAVPGATTEPELAAMMVGHEVRLEVAKDPATPGESVIEVRDLVVADERGQRAVDGVTFEVRAGEIVGVAGVQGNGQTELVEALTGLRRATGGAVRVLGRDTTHASPREIHHAGVAHVPEDRQRMGLVLDFSVADNLMLNVFDAPPFSSGIVLHREAVERIAEGLVREFDIRTPSVSAAVGTLSGGNQQKVIVAREFSRPLRLLIASQPTRGLDVGSIAYIHERIVGVRDGGAAVLVVSSELDEVLALADRILVMYRGRIVASVERADATRESIGLAMAGASAKAGTGEAPDG